MFFRMLFLMLPLFFLTNNVAFSRLSSIIPDTLVEAAMLGQTKHVKAFLENGEDINQQDEDGETALMTAVRFKREKVVALLLSRGAKPSITNVDGETIFEAMLNFDEPINRPMLKLLMGHEQDINQLNQEGNNILQSRLLFHSEHESLVSDIEYLIKKGVDVNNKNSSGASPIWNVCNLEETDNYKALIDSLVNNGADINAKDSEGDNLMAMTGCQESTAMKQYLLDKGAIDIN